MPDISWEHAADARAALRAIVSDPDHGAAALSSAQTMSNLLKDLLPDAPREKSILVAAAEAGLAASLREHVSQGMDPATAIRLTASSFSATTPYPPAACDWAASEIAIAIGVSKETDAAAAPIGLTPPAGSAGSWQPGSGQAGGTPAAHQLTTQAIPGLAGQPPWPQSAGGPGMPPPGQLPGQAAAGLAAPAPFWPPPGGYAPDPRFGAVPAIYQQPKNNGLAVAAMLCGIGQFIGWFIFLLPGFVAALLALIFGLVSMRQIRASGEAGRGMAVTGVVLGVLGLLGGILLIVLAIIGVLTSNSSS